MSEREAKELRLKMDLDLFDHLIAGHDHTPREACEAILRLYMRLGDYGDSE